MKKRPIKEQWFDSESEEINGKLRAKKPEIAINDGSEDWAMKGLNHGELKINELPDDPTIFMLDRNGQIVQFKPGGDIDFLTKYFIRKDIEDVDHKHLILEEGVRVDNLASLQRSTIKEFISSEKFVSGLTGEGFRIWNDILTGKWNGEFDNITIREIFFAFELLIQKYRSINGGLVISQGNGKIKSVTETETHYLLEMEGDITFMPDDFVRCQTWGQKQKYYWVKVDGIEGNTVKVLKSEFYDKNQPLVYPFDFTDSDKWMFDRHQNIDIERTNHSINLTRAGAEVLLVVTHDSPINETEHIRLKITGVNTESTLITADDEHMDGITIDKDGVYNFYYTQTPELGVWGIFYKGTTGEKNILIEQIPNPVDIPEENLPAAGDELVQMGNETDVTRQALILLSAAGDGKPVIDVLAGVNSKSFSGKLMTRVGDLSGIVDPDFPSDRQPSGFGIYCPNFYGKGMLILSSGETIEDYTNRTIIEAVPGEVRSEVSKMQIGANNFLPDSSFEEGNPFTTGSWVESFQEYKPVYGSKMIAWENVKSGDWYTTNIPYIKIKPNTDYVFSIYLCYDGDFTRTSSAIFLATGTTFDTVTRAEYIPLPSEKKTWERVILPFKSAENENYFSFRLGAVSETGLKMLLADAMQLEEGTVATAWRESTGDVLSQSKSLIQQTADEINLSVITKTKAGKIYIKGSGFENPHDRSLIINDDGVNQFINSRGFALAVIQRSNLLIREISYYDVYGVVADQNSLTEKLNSLDDSVFVILSSYDAINISEPLQAAIQRCGGTAPRLGYRNPYAFLGIPGLGLGRGLEVFSIDTTAPPAEITTTIINEMFTGSDNAAYQYAKTEVIVASDKIRLQLNNTGIDIENGQITLNAESTTIKSGDANIAMFKIEDGQPVIQGRFLKLSDGAEIAGFTVTPDSLHSYDGKSSISIGTLSAGYRGITLSTKNATLLNVFAGTVTGTGITSNAPTALVTYGSVEMHQRENQTWNVAGILFGGTVYGPYLYRWGDGAGSVMLSVTSPYSRYTITHELNHTDYHVIATPYYDSSDGNYAMHLNSYIRVENKRATSFDLQVVNADNGKGVDSGIMFTIIGRNN